MKTHDWTETDDAAALYVYRFGHQGVARSKSALADGLGISLGSFRMRIQNFQAIDNGGGLGNYAKQSARIYEYYKNATEPELRGVVLSAIADARAAHK
jgi:hypothetical protein